MVIGFIFTSYGLFVEQLTTSSRGLAIANTCFWVVFAITVELYHQYYKRHSKRELAVNKDLALMSVTEFKHKCHFEKRQLWIMDNCVLDNAWLPPLGHYDHWHPGGKFTLTKNYGRDISKYFYGGYMLVNSAPKEKVKNHS